MMRALLPCPPGLGGDEDAGAGAAAHVTSHEAGEFDENGVESAGEVSQIETVERVVEVPQLQCQERIVEVPQVQYQEVIKHVPVVQVQEIVQEVPQIQPQTVEKIVDVPQIRRVDKVVEVPAVQAQEVIKHVPEAEMEIVREFLRVNMADRIYDYVLMPARLGRPVRWREAMDDLERLADELLDSWTELGAMGADSTGAIIWIRDPEEKCVHEVIWDDPEEEELDAESDRAS